MTTDAPLSLLMLALVAFPIAFASSPASAEVPFMQVTMTPDQCTADKITVRVDLTNEGLTPVSVERAFLPWEAQDSLLLVAVSDDAEDRVLVRTKYLIHHAPEIVTIGPGKKLSGVLELRREFPSLINELTKRDVIVFWSYELETTEGSRSERSAGSIGFRSGQTVPSKCNVF